MDFVFNGLRRKKIYTFFVEEKELRWDSQTLDGRMYEEEMAAFVK